MPDLNDSNGDPPTLERTLHLNTRTPIWTGGATGKMKRLHETSILGGLRWWCELFVRGLGGKVSDPVSDKKADRSSFDADKYEKYKDRANRQRLLKAGLCDVSQIFGATGWRRRFRLDVRAASMQNYTEGFQKGRNNVYIVSDRLGKPDRHGHRRKARWYLPDYPQSGQFDLHLRALDPQFDVDIIAGLVQFLIDWAGIGAKNQLGLGVIQPREADRIDTAPLYNWLCGHAGKRSYKHVPTLDNLFLAKVVTRYPEPKQTFNLKYDLRNLDLLRNNTALRHYIMGTTKGSRRIASKVSISLPYEEDGQHFMRIWGWIPHLGPQYGGATRGDVLEAIYAHLGSTSKGYSNLEWRVLNSERDTSPRNLTDKQVFLRSLLQIEEPNNA